MGVMDHLCNDLCFVQRVEALVETTFMDMQEGEPGEQSVKRKTQSSVGNWGER